jgi:hypothetical protein
MEGETMLDDLLARAAQHVEPELSPREYTDVRKLICDSVGRPYIPYRDDDDSRRVWEHIPKHTIARCPLCGAAYTEQVDTYNVEDVWMLGDTPSIFQHHSSCEHYVSAQGFVHLNGVIPDPYYRGGSEVPYVMPSFLPDDPESYAVMHCLPVHRAEGEVFVPRYLLFAVTYYSVSPRILQQKRDEVRFEPDMKPLPPMYTWIEARGDKEAWDLVRWVREGKLWWLDLDQDDLPLRNGPVEEFPYASIEGIRKGFAYVKGKLKFDPY